MNKLALATMFEGLEGQNYGAKLYGRVMEGTHFAYRVVMTYGLCVAVVLFVSTIFISGLFTDQLGLIQH